MASKTAIQPHEFERPVLDLSGEMLRAAMQAMVTGSEEHGGIERYIDAVKLKSTMFREALVDNSVDDLELGGVVPADLAEPAGPAIAVGDPTSTF